MRRLDITRHIIGFLWALPFVIPDDAGWYPNGLPMSEGWGEGFQSDPYFWTEGYAEEEDKRQIVTYKASKGNRTREQYRSPVSTNSTDEFDSIGSIRADPSLEKSETVSNTSTAALNLSQPPSSAAYNNSMSAPTPASTITSTAIPLVTSSSDPTKVINTQTQYSYVTQDPLHVNDSSDKAFSIIFKLSAGGKYSDVFDTKVVSAMEDEKSWSKFSANTMNQQASNRQHYVEAVPKDRLSPFLYTGKVESRTKKNCYVLRTKDILTHGTRSKVKEVLEAIGGVVKHAYDMKGMNGFSVCFPKDQLPLTFLKSITGLEWVERDQYVRYKQVQEGAPWQLARLNDPLMALSDKMEYDFNATGRGVNVYIIDSGVMSSHPEFGGRAKVGYSVFKDFPEDCAGHGTEVASVIVGTNVGVAKLANVTVMQVLDCDGQGENSSVLSALNWIAKNHVKPAVINMSVGGPKSISVDEAVQAAVNAGIPVVVAAGNSKIDACTLSPSGVEAAMVVGASTYDLKRAVFSNFGSCVEIFAPGSHVVAAAIPSEATTNGYTFVSGTSLSAPLVTGIYALLLQANPNSTPYELKQKILSAASKGLLDKGTLMGSPNLLAAIPSIPPMGVVELSYVPPGTLPYLNPPANSNTVEWVLIAVGAGVVILFLLLLLLVLWRRRRNAAERRAKFSSAFQ